ncbi:MAG: glycosyltransferase family 2 protein [Oscillospiraceae bacterium]|jgi:glycosyltransferase involved in cell wall biosynthesis|nr:glycosyltransferase family 2 protein [Oscillospiraceae bacterium]
MSKQGKVSMVMPCYNKVGYIGGMFDSVLAQEWDNIELILVNDGSTDGTREVIAEYEPKFRARGYEVVIVDQENGGVCAAAKAGLSRISGDYVCCVDADDELDPEYASTMAGWLETHGEYDYCICDCVLYTGRGKAKDIRAFTRKTDEKSDHRPERFLLQWNPCWTHMVRNRYFLKCRVVETYYTDTKGSHEPGFMIPLEAGSGKNIIIPLPLYRHNFDDGSHSRGDPKYVMQSKQEYLRLCEIAINALSVSVADEARKSVLRFCAKIKYYEQLVCRFEKKDALSEALLLVNEYFNCDLKLENCESLEYILFPAIKSFLLGENGYMRLSDAPDGKVVAYGALGVRGRRFLPLLDGTGFEPDELWDVRGDGMAVKQPDFERLTRDDLVIIFPRGLDIDVSPARGITWEDLLPVIAAQLFPELFQTEEK